MNRLFLLFVLALMWSNCASDPAAEQEEVATELNAPPAADYSGDWNFMVKGTPEGDIKGVMTLSKKASDFEGVLSFDEVEAEMTDVNISGNTMTFKVTAGGYSTSIKGTFSTNMFNGTLSAEGYDFDFTALKK